MMSENNLIYAIKNGEVVHISEVESGLKCGCVCPSCEENLVAKKGTERVHHFAHRSGHNCEYGYETSLHLAAKDILSNAKEFMLPEVFVEFPNSNKEKQLLSSARRIPIDNVKLEKRYCDMIPDIVLVSGEKVLIVEIFVTHRIDDIKLEKIKNANISTIEIDLSKQDKTITKEDLSQILLRNSDLKIWKYNASANEKLNRFYSVSERLKIDSSDNDPKIDDCPIDLRIWKKKSYAYFKEDCLNCKFLIDANSEEIICSGKRRISTIKDFNVSYEQRLEKWKKENPNKDTKNAILFCPYCGEELLEKHGRYRSSLDCRNEPYCKFSVRCDKKGRVSFRDYQKLSK